MHTCISSHGLHLGVYFHPKEFWLGAQKKKKKKKRNGEPQRSSWECRRRGRMVNPIKRKRRMLNPEDIAGERRRRRMGNPRDIAGERRRRRRMVNPRDIAGKAEE